MWIRIKDLLFSIKEIFAVWFVPNHIINRRMHFLETGVSDKGKRTLAYKILLSLYRLKVK